MKVGRDHEPLDPPAATKRVYTVGVPLWVTFEDDGRIVLDFDLTEVSRYMEPADAVDEEPQRLTEDEIEADADIVSAVLDNICNTHQISLRRQS